MMYKNIVPEDIELSKLIKDHSEEAKMSEIFKSTLFSEMHKMIDAQKSRNKMPWLKQILIGTTLTMCVYFMALQFRIPQMVSNVGRKPIVWSGPTYAVLPLKTMNEEKYLAVTSISGTVTDAYGRILKTGDNLSGKTDVRTSRDSRITLVTLKGTQFHLDSDTILRLNDGNGRILKGRLYCSNRMGEVKSIDTPGGHIRLLGTVINTAVLNKYSSAITVLKGKVQLSNDHGLALVGAGKRSILTAYNTPEDGTQANIIAETAWYEGRNKIISDTGQIVYHVSIPESTYSAMTQIWAMNADGTGKHLVKTYIGYVSAYSIRFWMPGGQWVLIDSRGPLYGKIDHKRRSAFSNLGYTIGGGVWLLNVSTGQDMPFEVSKDEVCTMELSPDGRKLAYINWAAPKINTILSERSGLYIYDLKTGENHKVLGGSFATKLSWSSDAKYLFLNAEHVANALDQSILMVNVESGQAKKIIDRAAGGQISPDGKKLAYWSDFRDGSIECYGVPRGGSIYVKALTVNAKPKRITEWGQGYDLTWSPDSTKILYRETVEEWQKSHNGGDIPQHFKLFIAQADGSGVEEISKGDSALVSTAWTPDGNGLYIRTSDDILLMDAEGREIKSLVGTSPSSALTSAEMLQSDQAMSAIREAVYQYALGDNLRLEKKLSDARKHYRLAGDLFNEIAWRYPLMRFGTEDSRRCADQAYNMAK